MNATNPHGFSSAALALSQMHLSGKLAPLKPPTLFLGGLQDKAVASALLSEYANPIANPNANPNFRYASIPGPHLLNIENPIGFNHAILEFFGEF
jgi:3-oxoadipate enol-lactonase